MYTNMCSAGQAFSTYAMCQPATDNYIHTIHSIRTQTALKLFYKPQLISTDRIKVIKGKKINPQTVTQSNDFKCIISNRENEWQSPSVLSPHRSVYTKITFTKCNDAHEWTILLPIVGHWIQQKQQKMILFSCTTHTQKKIFSLVSLDYHDDVHFGIVYHVRIYIYV